MKSFTHSNGMIISFGFDPFNKLPAPNMVAWSDVDGKTWEIGRFPSTSMAGYKHLKGDVLDVEENEYGDVFVGNARAHLLLHIPWIFGCGGVGRGPMQAP